VASGKLTKDYFFDCNAVIVASNLDDGLSAGTAVLALGFNFLIVTSNRLLGLSAGTVALQLVLQRLLIVASSCCDGVVVVVLGVVEDVLLPSPPQEARRIMEEANRNKEISRFILISPSKCKSSCCSVVTDTSATQGRG
jgi:hypothetical protein